MFHIQLKYLQWIHPLDPIHWINPEPKSKWDIPTEPNWSDRCIHRIKTESNQADNNNSTPLINTNDKEWSTLTALTNEETQAHQRLFTSK